MNEDQVDCIVRFHDIERLRELNRCIFSLVGQRHRPLNIILALQRFSEEQVAATREALAPLLLLPDAPMLTLCNLDQPMPRDGRTLLLNMGLQASTGRYVCFLDYDDVLYPEAHAMLVAQLKATQAAIAFATVRVVRAAIHRQFVEMFGTVEKPFGNGRGLLDLFRNNFCPIHSFLVDRQKVAPADLFVDTTLTWEEDYDFLLRICAEYQSDFGLIETQIGDYYYKTDGSNSVPHGGMRSPELLAAYAKVSAKIEARRRTTLLSSGVQAAIGVAQPKPDMTIRSLLDQVA